MIEQLRANFRIKPSYSRGRSYPPGCRNCCCVALLLLVLAMSLWFVLQHPIHTLIKSDQAPHDHTGGRVKQALKLASFGIANVTTPQSLQERKINPMMPMVCLALLLAFFYLKLLKIATQCMLYSSVFITTALMLWWAGLRFLFGAPLLGLIVVILTVAYLLAVWCYFRNHYKSTVVMIRLTAQFLSDSFTLVFIPAILVLIGIWTVGSFKDIAKEADLLTELGLLFWGACSSVFYFFFSFYIMVYLVANRAADWFYGRKSSCCEGLGRLFSHHLGTIAFAAFIIPIVKLMQLVAWVFIGDPKSGRALFLQPFLGACLQEFQILVYTLNDMAIILCTETGHDFIDAASTAGVVVLDHFGLFATLDILGLLLSVSGVIISTVMPTFIHLLLGHTFEWYGELMVPQSALWIAVVCAIAGFMVMCLFSEALLAIYLFYCFEKELHKFGIGFPDFAIREPLLTPDYLLYGNLEGFRPIVILNTAMEQDGNLVYRPIIVDPPRQPQPEPVIPPHLPRQYPEPYQTPPQVPSPLHPSLVQPPRLLSSNIQSNIMRTQHNQYEQPNNNYPPRSNYAGVNYPQL